MVTQLNFYCESGMMLSLIGVAFTLGVVIGCVTLARLADIYGRKPIFILGMLLEISCAVCFLFCTNWILADLLFLIFGASLIGSRFVGYTYLIELMPTDKQVIVGTTEFLMEAAVYLFNCLFFFYISKNW
jgi:MFS family permease